MSELAALAPWRDALVSCCPDCGGKTDEPCAHGRLPESARALLNSYKKRTQRRREYARDSRWHPPADARVMFERRVVRAEGCWQWKGYITTHGYGSVQVGGREGRIYSAHRLSWELHNGPIPEGFVVCHSCDNPPCTNPAHLFLGTQADNMRDMARKGRQPGNRTRLRPPPSLHPLLIEHLRLHFAEGVPRRQLAQEFGVSLATVWKYGRSAQRKAA